MRLYNNKTLSIFVLFLSFHYIFSGMTISDIATFSPSSVPIINVDRNTVNMAWIEGIIHNMTLKGINMDISNESSINTVAQMIWASPTFKATMNTQINSFVGNKTELRQRFWESLLRGLDEVSKKQMQTKATQVLFDDRKAISIIQNFVYPRKKLTSNNTADVNWIRAIMQRLQNAGVVIDLNNQDTINALSTLIFNSNADVLKREIQSKGQPYNLELQNRIQQSISRQLDEIRRKEIGRSREQIKPIEPVIITRPLPTPSPSGPVVTPKESPPVTSKKTRQPSGKRVAATSASRVSSQVAQQGDYALLLSQYENFVKNIGKFPTTTNNVIAVAGNDPIKQNKIVAFAKETYPVVDPKVITLCQDFINFKKTNGSSIEKALYNNMSVPTLMIRLFEKRPLMFMMEQDLTLLRGINQKAAAMDWTKVGTEQEATPLVLRDYLSYDEMKVAALIGLSNPTYFINKGDRNNKGGVGTPGTFEEEGIYTGLVGTRFERSNLMEWQDIIITQKQNTESNGYGLKGNKGLVKIWSDLYGMKFPTYQEAAADTSGKYIKFSQGFFNMPAFKKRLELVIKPFLVDANTRAKNNKNKAYVHMVGLGLGAWAIKELINEETTAIVEVYKDLLANNSLPFISDIDFSWFGNVSVPGMTHGNAVKDKGNNSIMIHFSKRNPADKLTGNDAGKLLVACYAWDGNSFPGNEYWDNRLTASGDPAAACCSLIATLQNIWINPWLKENIMKIYSRR